jgi:hypothetical protein
MLAVLEKPQQENFSLKDNLEIRVIPFTPVTLIEILSTLLKNSLICIKTYLPSVHEILVSEYEANFNIIIHDLFAIFPKMNTLILLKFTSIKLRVEFDDKKDEKKNIS